MEQELYNISHLVKQTKKRKNKHYISILLGDAKGRLGKANFVSLRILLDSGSSSSIVLGRHKNKLCCKHTQPVKCSTQGDDFITTYKTNVELILPELDVTKRVTCSFQVDELQKN